MITFEKEYYSLLVRIVLGLFCVFSINSYASASTCSNSCEQAKIFYFSGEIEKAAKEFLPLADSGEAESQYYLGLIYLDKQWAGHDGNKAIALFSSAADQNHAASMWKLGELHETGEFVEKDLLRATDWYRKSQRINDDQTIIQFFNMRKGELEEQSKDQVLEKALKLASANDIDAQVRLAKIYDSGSLTHPDDHKSFYWYQKAAQHGNAYAMYMTGYFYCRGIGVELNETEANKWLALSGRAATCKD